MSIESRVKQLEENFKNIAEGRELCDRANAKSIEESNAVFGEAKRNFVETSASLEEALCDIDAVASDRLADLEEALCELSEIMEEGGNENG